MLRSSYKATSYGKIKSHIKQGSGQHFNLTIFTGKRAQNDKMSSVTY